MLGVQQSGSTLQCENNSFFFFRVLVFYVRARIFITDHCYHEKMSVCETRACVKRISEITAFLQNTKLSAIKVDSKFTTTTQIVKLMGSHNISKVSIRISDLKRTKMVCVNFLILFSQK